MLEYTREHAKPQITAAPPVAHGAGTIELTPRRDSGLLEPGVAPEHARLSAFQRRFLRLRFLVVQTFISSGRVPGELGRSLLGTHNELSMVFAAGSISGVV